MDKGHLIQEQPLLREIFKEPPLISYRKAKSLKDMLVLPNGHTEGVALVCQPKFNYKQETTTKYMDCKDSGLKRTPPARIERNQS